MITPTAPKLEPTSFHATSSVIARQPRLAPFSEKDEARIDAVTLDTAHRCLITNCLPQHAVDYAHLMPRAAVESELTRLEYAWGLRWGTLNIDTHFNVLRLRKDIHTLFDEGKLILLPEQDIVYEYIEGGKPDFEGDRRNNVRYKYTLIASRDLDGYSFRRLRFPAQPGESQEPMDFSYPFADFPTLESQLHPCFAICHAGRPTSNVFKFRQSTSRDLFNLLTCVQSVYLTWNMDTPCLEFRKNPKLSPDGDDDDRSDAGKTRMYRVDHFSFLQRIRNHKNNDPPEEEEEERNYGWDQHDCYDGKRCIDLYNLREISRGFSYVEDRNERKRKSIRNWVSSIIGQTFVEDDDMMSQVNQT